MPGNGIQFKLNRTEGPMHTGDSIKMTPADSCALATYPKIWKYEICSEA